MRIRESGTRPTRAKDEHGDTIAPYLLTALMATPGWLVYLSSSMHRGGSTDLTKPTTARGSYSDSKLWVTALSAALAHRWPGTSTHAVDPGWVPTSMGGAGAPDDPTEGHRTQVWLATAPGSTPFTGGYWHHHRTQNAAPVVHDDAFRAALRLCSKRSRASSCP